MQTPLTTIQFHYHEVRFPFSNRTRLRDFITRLFKKEKKGLDSLNFIFCTDEYLLNINRDFLQHDYYTDIITFELSTTKNTTGEIYISIDRVKDNAAQQNIVFQTELHRVIFHGALHLCGYGDKTKDEQTTMRRKEDFYIAAFQKETK